MKKTMNLAALLAATMAMTACTSTVSESITDEGTVDGKVIFPEMDDATQPEGVFPTMDALALVGSGVTKKQLYHLIGRPHFSEINGAREWDYIMKFREDDGSVKTCQYKVIFDEDKLARSFFWKPKNCVSPQSVDLSADALFNFNKSGMADLKTAGKRQLEAFAKQTVADGNQAQLTITGYTDYLGSESYNQALSEERANTVKDYLAEKGVNAENMTIAGMGEANPIVQCESGLSRSELVDCLAPNRRVTITAE